MTCAGIHTHYSLEDAQLYECAGCREQLETTAGPLPRLCPLCAEDRGACAQCGRRIEEDQ